MRQLLRLIAIGTVALRYGLDQLALERAPVLRRALATLLFWRDLSTPRGVRLRLALETLGPIFVKFGQVLSTRRDLLPVDIADELARLQDQVPPFSRDGVEATLLRAYGRPVDQVFHAFEFVAAASASVAQVHFGEIRLNDAIVPVAVKILRPEIRPVITHDLALLRAAAMLVERVFVDGRRLRPMEVVAEFERHLEDEQDLMREAANCSQLGRNFARSTMLLVPAVHWDWCRSEVMVMERMDGIPISHVARLADAGVDIPLLARTGVEIFFTQVFRDGFFHADMHPGNIQVSVAPAATRGRYIALDFGIMGTLSDSDKQYLAINFLAFFRRDYRRVATAHLESGWVPADTRVDALEAEIRVVCEPLIGKPLKDISLGLVLMQLFRASRRFNVEIQPQLVLLQKTLLNVEGLGRHLYPDLDLWQTAKPYLERWMERELGPEAFFRRMEQEAPYWVRLLPQLPRLVGARLRGSDEIDALHDRIRLLTDLSIASRRSTRLLIGAVTALAIATGLALVWLLLPG